VPVIESKIDEIRTAQQNDRRVIEAIGATLGVVPQEALPFETEPLQAAIVRTEQSIQPEGELHQLVEDKIGELRSLIEATAKRLENIEKEGKRARTPIWACFGMCVLIVFAGAAALTKLWGGL